MKNPTLLLMYVLVLLVAATVAQQPMQIRKVATLPSACSALSTRAVLYKTGSGAGLYQCVSGTYVQAASKLYDQTYTGVLFTPRTNRFSVASNDFQVVPSTNHFVGLDVFSKVDMSGSTSKDFVGISNGFGVDGDGVNLTLMGIFNQLSESTGFSGNYDSMYGIWNRVTPNQAHLSGDMYGIRSSVGSGGFVFTTDPVESDIVGIYSNAIHGYGVTANQVMGAILQTQGANANATGASVTDLIGLKIRHFGGSGTAVYNQITNRYGIYLGEYSTINYEVANNYGIYIDSTIDELGTAKFAIYSLSTSPSFFSGKLNFDATYTAGGTTGDQVINKPAFSVNFAAAATSLTVTNSFVTTSSVLLCTVQTNDTTMKSVAAVAGSGSVVLHANAAANAETKVYCEVKN